MPIGTNNSVIAGCGMHHVTVQARDWEASLRLYRDVLGMEITAEFGSPEHKMLLLDMGDGSYIELAAPSANTPSVGSEPANDPLTHVALTTTDIHAAVELVREAGYEITMEPTDVDLGGLLATVAFFNGPSGERIEWLALR